MRALLLLALSAFPLLAADPTVTAFVPAQPLLDGGEVSCTTKTSPPACVWATTQYSGALYSPSEIAGCVGSYTGGVFQCSSPATCLTCGLDATLFPPYTQNTPSNVSKGQPFFEDSAGTYLFLWVSAQNVSGGACGSSTPGGGVCGDTWYMPISVSATAVTLSTAMNLTAIMHPVNGVLYARTGGGYIWMSYRFAVAGVQPSCSLGGWGIRVWPYIFVGSTLSPQAELSSAASPFQPIGACSYTEMSGFYDTTSGEFTYQGTPTSSSPFWRSNIYGFNLNYTGGPPDLIVPWGTNGLYAWDEHANTDANDLFITWSSSFGATAGPYDGSKGIYGNCGATCTGLLPLDKWVAPIPRYIDSAGVKRLGTIGPAYQLTQFNVLGSSDRAFICASLAGGCSTSTVISGGYADTSQPNILTYQVKQTTASAPSPSGVYGLSLTNFTSKLIGAAVLQGNATLQ